MEQNACSNHIYGLTYADFEENFSHVVGSGQNFQIQDNNLKIKRLYLTAGASAERGLEAYLLTTEPTNSVHIVKFWE